MFIDKAHFTLYTHKYLDSFCTITLIDQYTTCPIQLNSLYKYTPILNPLVSLLRLDIVGKHIFCASFPVSVFFCVSLTTQHAEIRAEALYTINESENRYIALRFLFSKQIEEGFLLSSSLHLSRGCILLFNFLKSCFVNRLDSLKG